MESLARAFGDVSVSLLAGYLFLRISPYRGWRADHLRSDRFAFHVFGFSIICYTAGVAIASVISFKFPHGFVDTYLSKAGKYLELKPSTICAFAAGPFLAAADRMIIMLRMLGDPAVKEHAWFELYKKSAAAAVARFVFKCDDAAIRTLHRATFYLKPLMLTLKSGKVYVGIPVKGIANPSVHANYIKIFPIYSGYRDPDTHKVNFLTRYRDITSQITARQNEKPAHTDDPLAEDMADLRFGNGNPVAIDLQDIGVVILWSEVVTVSLYDENFYQAFQAVGPPQKKSSGLFGKDGVLAGFVRNLLDGD
jgi:hypothetical protein